jgi:hypothetical protein
MLKDEIKIKNKKKGLTRKTRNLNHETKIIKVNGNKS